MKEELVKYYMKEELVKYYMKEELPDKFYCFPIFQLLPHPPARQSALINSHTFFYEKCVHKKTKTFQRAKNL